MSLGRDVVARIAALAEIAVTEDELEPLVAQLDRIVGYVAQLDTLPPEAEPVEPFVPGPQRVSWREDRVDPVPLARSPEQMAPAWREGFFVVPRLGAMDAEEA